MTNPEETTQPDTATIEVVDEVPITEKKKQVRRIRAPHRYLPNGKYDNKPSSPTYFSDYYNATKEPCECPHCHQIYTHKTGLQKHYKRSDKCKKIRGEVTRKEMSALDALALVSAVSEFEKLD